MTFLDVLWTIQNCIGKDRYTSFKGTSLLANYSRKIGKKTPLLWPLFRWLWLWLSNVKLYYVCTVWLRAFPIFYSQNVVMSNRINVENSDKLGITFTDKNGAINLPLGKENDRRTVSLDSLKTIQLPSEWTIEALVVQVLKLRELQFFSL